MSSLPSRAAIAAGQFLKENPGELWRAAQAATKFQLGVPLSALRWIIREVLSDRGPKDIVLRAQNGGLYLEASVELLSTPIRATTTLQVEDIQLSPETVMVDIRLTNLKLRVEDPTVATPVSALLQSGALDTSRPGDLLRYLPKKPEIIIEAEGDRFRLDLMKLPALKSPKGRTAVSLIAPLLGVKRIQSSDDDHIDISVDPLPEGAQAAWQSIKRWF